MTETAERTSDTAGDYANPHVLVTTEWAAQNLTAPNLRFVEVDVDTSSYDTGHIPGAIGWDWKKDLQRRPVRDIPSKEDWEALLSRSGVGNDTTVILYGDNNNWFAAFAYWLFKLYGHDDVRLINGGRKKWIDEGREQTTDAPSVQSTTYTAKEADKKLRVFRDEVANASGNLVDVRSPGEFSGELLAPENLPQEGAQRGGHIKGARNIPWGTAVNAETGAFKSAADLKAIYGGKGITPETETIAYCRIGERSAHTWFVLRELLGHPNVRNYDGSWTEWGSLIGAEIETGSGV